MKNKETFVYSYNAKEQDEIKKIRDKYSLEKNSLERLRMLDQGVTKKATVRSITTGVFGALLMGIGMSVVMTDLINVFGSFKTAGLVTGIILGVLGVAVLCFAYPVYTKTLKKEREKIAPEILSISEELLK